jgi:hypothetical protein
LTTYYVLFFIHLATRRVNLAGFTPYPDQEWMEQQARNMPGMSPGKDLPGRLYLQRALSNEFLLGGDRDEFF